MRPELKGLNGGAKQHWLRMHRKEVENFYFQHGAEATMEEFNLSQDTLRRFWDRKNNDVRLNKLSEADRYVLQIAKAGDSELRRQINSLIEWRDEVEPIINVGRALIKATMGSIEHRVSHTPLPDDLLTLPDFGEKS